MPDEKTEIPMATDDRAHLGPPDPNCDVSIVLVNWNTRDMLRDCLRSIVDGTKLVRYEIIVVDNGSTDGSPEMIASEFPQVLLIRNVENLGYSRASNAGIRHTRGRHIFTLNTDAIIVDDAVSGLVRFMDANPDAAVGGCMLRYGDGRLQASCGWFPTLRSTLMGGFSLESGLRRVRDESHDFGGPFVSYAEHERSLDVDWIVGACLIARREALEQVGLMDEAIFLYSEEIDWCFRMKKAGWRVVYTPDVEVIHFGGGSTTMPQGTVVHAILSSLQYFARKHFGHPRAIAHRAMVLIGSLARCVFWPALYLVWPSRRCFFKERTIWNFNALLWSLWRGPTRLEAPRKARAETKPAPAGEVVGREG